MPPFVRFEVLTAVVMKSSIFWDVTPCSLLKVNQRFGGRCRHHLQGRRKSRARNQLDSGRNQLDSGWQAELFDPEYGGDMFLRNVGCLSTDYTALYLRRQNSSWPHY
jgi:hypothetical protein